MWPGRLIRSGSTDLGEPISPSLLDGNQRAECQVIPRAEAESVSVHLFVCKPAAANIAIPSAQEEAPAPAEFALATLQTVSFFCPFQSDLVKESFQLVGGRLGSFQIIPIGKGPVWELLPDSCF